ncbi:MAG TPA: FecR domain-containing protein [Chthoniobacterales bacterium]
MKITCKILAGFIATVSFLLPDSSIGAGSKEARVTEIIREVKLLPADKAARAAALNDKVADDTGVRTGGESRSELTFPDLTITRLGANTIFSFSKSGRTANVDSGSILLRVPKDSGGGSIRNNAVTVAITGTTVIFEGTRSGRSKVINLEGSSRVTLKKKPKDFRQVLAGQMLDVPAGATTLPMPVNIDLNQLMRTHPLITDFKPLPSEPLIAAAAQQPPPPVYAGPNTGPVFLPPQPNRGPNPVPYPTPKTQPTRTPRPGTNGADNPTAPSNSTKPTPTPPPVITRTAPPKQTYVPSKTPTRVQRVTRRPTPPPIR